MAAIYIQAIVYSMNLHKIIKLIILILLGAFLVSFNLAEARVSSKTISFVKSFEGFYSCPYNDPAGHATIGYGHLLHTGPVTRADLRRGCWSKKRATKQLKRDLVYYDRAVRKRLNLRARWIGANTVTALTSFAFNVGVGKLGKTRPPKPTNIVANLNRGRVELAVKQLRYFMYIYPGGKKTALAGLKRRRTAECQLIYYDAYSFTGKLCS